MLRFLFLGNRPIIRSSRGTLNVRSRFQGKRSPRGTIHATFSVSFPGKRPIPRSTRETIYAKFSVPRETTFDMLYSENHSCYFLGSSVNDPVLLEKRFMIRSPVPRETTNNDTLSSMNDSCYNLGSSGNDPCNVLLGERYMLRYRFLGGTVHAIFPAPRGTTIIATFSSGKDSCYVLLGFSGN